MTKTHEDTKPRTRLSHLALSDGGGECRIVEDAAHVTAPLGDRPHLTPTVIREASGKILAALTLLADLAGPEESLGLCLEIHYPGDDRRLVVQADCDDEYPRWTVEIRTGGWRSCVDRQELSEAVAGALAGLTREMEA